MSLSSSRPDIRIIVATDQKGGFSKDNEIPWNIPEDFAYFRRITSQTNHPHKNNAVIMGRKTFETTGVLKNRINIILSQTQTAIQTEKPVLGHYYRCQSLRKAVKLAVMMECPILFIIGGERVYTEALETLPVNTIYRTLVEGDYNCDRFFPLLSNLPFYKMEEKEPNDETGICFQTWKRT